MPAGMSTWQDPKSWAPCDRWVPQQTEAGPRSLTLAPRPHSMWHMGGGGTVTHAGRERGVRQNGDPTPAERVWAEDGGV